LALISAIVLTTGSLAAVATAADASVPPTPAGYTLVYSDDFTGSANTAIDSSWIQDTGTGYPGGAANWGTGEVETMTGGTSNVHLDGHGDLGIKPLKDSAGHWTSGRVETSRTSRLRPAASSRSTR
jgi:hypothetical protein